LTVSLADGSDTTTNTTLQNISWEKDYLTSSRPWALKGASVTLPLGTTAPVKGIGFTGTTGTASGNTYRESSPLPNRVYTNTVTTLGNPGAAFESDTTGANSKPLIYADLSSATAIDINTVRHAFVLPRYE